MALDSPAEDQWIPPRGQARRARRAQAGNPNRPAPLVLNLQPWKRNARVREYTPQQFRDYVSKRIEEAHDRGFGRLLLFEPGERGLRDLYAPKRAVRPLTQLSTMPPGFAEVLRDLTAAETRRAPSESVALDVYTGTYNRFGVDEVPGHTTAYLEEGAGWARLGFERWYIDWSAWTSDVHNLLRGGEVRKKAEKRHAGGGDRVRGSVMLERTLRKLGHQIHVGVEPLPKLNHPEYPSYALAMAQTLPKVGVDESAERIRLASALGHERTLLLRGQEDLDEFRNELNAAARAGAVFGSFTSEKTVVQAIARLNALGAASRD